MVPDKRGFISANFHGDQIEGAIGDTAVNVNPLVVIIAGIVVIHVGRLRVFAKETIIVGRSGSLHGAQRFPVKVRPHNFIAHQPVRLAGILFEGVLRYGTAENI